MTPNSLLPKTGTTTKRTIVDAFLFFNELDTLELRIEELESVVDYFVLVESGEGFSSARKPFLFDENKHRFSRYLDRIHQIKLPGLPPLSTDTEAGRFRLQRFQRDAIMLGLVGHGLQPDDIILISDVDEIPSKESVLKVSNKIEDDEIWIFKQQYYKLFLDADMPPEAREWLGTIAIKYSVLGQASPDDLRTRFAARFYESARDDVPTSGNLARRFAARAGWHLTYFGGDGSVKYKVANYAAGARDAPGAASSTPVASVARETSQGLLPITEALECELRSRIGRLEHNIPTPILENLAKYYHLFRCSYDPSAVKGAASVGKAVPFRTTDEWRSDTKTSISQQTSAPACDVEAWTRALYEVFLMREADPIGLATHARSLNSGKTKPDHLIRAFLRSNEFREKSFKFATTYLDHLLTHPRTSDLPLRKTLNATMDDNAQNITEPKPLVQYIVSLGTHCYTSWLLEQMNLRKYSLPFDYVFSDLGIISDCVDNNFSAFLDKTKYVKIDDEGRCGHKFYSKEFNLPIIFNHHNVTEPDSYDHFVRSVERFRKILRNEGHKLFLCVTNDARTDDGKIKLLSDAISSQTNNCRIIVIMVSAPATRREMKLDRRIGHADVYSFCPLTEMVNGLSFADELDNKEIEKLLRRIFTFEIRDFLP
jgi:beta-1,4-mannosyl-glycoprotein beta-1,4-N-acetylglucosaminyltransferase